MDFDPTLKKKKKKKVVLDEDGEAVEAVTGEMDDMGFGEKKKKKSKSKEDGEEGD